MAAAPVAVARMPSHSRESEDSSVFTFSSRSSGSPMKRRTNVLVGKFVAAGRVQGGIQDCNEDDDDGGGKMSAADLNYFQFYNGSLRREDDHRNMDHNDESHAFRFSSRAFATTTTTAANTTLKQNGATLVTPEDKEVIYITVSSPTQTPQSEPTGEERTDTPLLIQTPCLMSVTDNSAAGAARIAMPPPQAAPRTVTTTTPPLASIDVGLLLQQHNTPQQRLIKILQEQKLFKENLFKTERRMEEELDLGKVQLHKNRADLMHLEYKCAHLNVRQISTDLAIEDLESRVGVVLAANTKCWI
jgi:hypothetical protein